MAWLVPETRVEWALLALGVALIAVEALR